MTPAAARFSQIVRETASHLFANQDEALARLNYLFENQRRAGIVLGPTGVGKTALLANFAKEIRRSGHDALLLDLFGVQDAEFLANLATKLGSTVPPQESRLRLWRGITDRLFENRLQRLRTVFLLDNVDEAHAEVMMIVTRLIQFDRSPESSITCVMAADPANVNRLGGRLLEQIDLRIELEPWSMAETVKYLDTPASAAKVNATNFTPAALERLHDLSGGLPRHVTRLAELAQLAASMTDNEQVDERTIDSVYSELSLHGILTNV